MKIVAIQTEANDNGIAITRSDIGVIFSDKLSELFEFLVQDSEDSLMVAWDLDETMSVFLRVLGSNICSKIWTDAKAEYKGYSLFYVQNKLFSISKNGKNISIYHLSQYFNEELDPHNLGEIMMFADQLMASLHNMKLFPDKLSSPVAIFKKNVLNYCDIPTIYNTNMPDELVEWSWLCGGRLWVQAYKLGYFRKSFDYDLRQAFSTALRYMIDLRECEFIKDNKYHQEAYYGFCKGYVTIYDHVTVHPIMHETILNEKREISTDIGIWEEKITKADWDFIKKWKIGSFELDEAWWIIPRRIKYPLRVIIDRLLTYKNSDDKLMSSNAKRMVNGIYGSLAQENKHEFGEFFNPIWFSYASDLARLEVCDMIYKHKAMNELIHVSVDGFNTTKPISQIAKERGIKCDCDICKAGL